MSVVSDEFNQRVAALSQVLLSEETIDSFLQRVANVSAALIPACDTCSVSVVADGGKVHTRVSSDAVAERADEHQYRGDQGPCLEAIAARRPRPDRRGPQPVRPVAAVRRRRRADQGFDIVRSLSQSRNMKLRDLAERLVFTGAWKEPGRTTCR